QESLLDSSGSKHANAPSAPYREIQKNEYSSVARLSLSLNPSPITGFEIFNILRSTPRAEAIPQYPDKQPRVLSLTRITSGSYIVELFGHVSLQNESSNGNLLPGLFPGHTFPFEFEHGKFIIDARKCGNFARYVRRSCEPNAELNVLQTGTDLHVMITAKKEIDQFIEITIAFDKDWKKQPRPLQGCACKRGGKCRLERYFSEKNESSNEDATSSASGKTERPRRQSIDERLVREFGVPFHRSAAHTTSSPLAPPLPLPRSDKPIISDRKLPRILLGNARPTAVVIEKTPNNDIPKMKPYPSVS
ncbi:hypothetical protein PMAYCL1PPCAC_01546, partial [Pristionchus mayeri]